MQITGIDKASGPDRAAVTVMQAGRIIALGNLPVGCTVLSVSMLHGSVLIGTDQGIFVSRGGVLEKLPNLIE